MRDDTLTTNASLLFFFFFPMHCSTHRGIKVNKSRDFFFFFFLMAFVAFSFISAGALTETEAEAGWLLEGESVSDCR